MYTVRLASETDFAGWRDAARAMRLNAVPPGEVAWRVGEAAGLFDGPPPPEPPRGLAFAAPRAFLDLAREAILHRMPERFDLLYRLLWRLRDAPRLVELVTDPEVAQALVLQRQVRDAEHKMHAFLRFRRVEPDGEGDDAVETYLAWFEPAHHVVERAADFFVDRMANLRFSILTPDRCAHWDGAALSFTPGVDRGQAPGEDALETYWRTYFAAVFNPARLNAPLMVQHMPKRYWRNLPEAGIIPELMREAETRTAVMVGASPVDPSPRARRRGAAQAALPMGEPAAGPEVAPAALGEIAAAIQACRRCDLWRDATQGVPGEGPAQAPLMFVGEQPGDMEDLAGKPFVGPAGQLFDRALNEAGVPRAASYVTNAVKHFKWEPRGKRRLHKRPDAGEVRACRWWLDHERRLVRPRVVVTLGATAASAVFGRTVSVTKERGPAGEIEGGVEAHGAPGAPALGFVTVHPSYLLRLPDPAAKAAEFDRFVADLAAAYALTTAA